ncbi:MAG: response regulator transcription factor [Kiritimatiellae bacterium]|nr:response regulator transcription factor [Kiritimatiellia bacterium]
MKILVVDDERSMADSLRDNFDYEGHSTTCAYSGQDALDCLKGDVFDLVILDVMMPDVDGFDVLATIRKEGVQTPVIFLTARSAEADKLRGLGLGGDDYVTKPFSLRELLARVDAVLRRSCAGSDLKEFVIGSAHVDLACLTIERDGAEHGMGRYEGSILRLLASAPGKVFSREDILNQVWGRHAFPTMRTVDNYIVKLRQKIEPEPGQPRYLTSVYGAGYRLSLD